MISLRFDVPNATFDQVFDFLDDNYLSEVVVDAEANEGDVEVVFYFSSLKEFIHKVGIACRYYLRLKKSVL